MAQIPIDRDLKIMLLNWLANGIDERELSELEYKYMQNEEELKADTLGMYDKLFEEGECEVLKGLLMCNPEVEPGNYFGKV